MRHPNYVERKKIQAERRSLRGWSYKLTPRQLAEGHMQHRFGPASMLRKPKEQYYLKDCDDALIEMLRPLLIAKNGDALMMVGESYNRRRVWRGPRYQLRTDASWIEIAAAQDHPHYIYIVGANFDLGERGYPYDPSRAFQCFEKAAALGHAHSVWLCGVSYLEGRGVDKNVELGLQLIQRAAELKFHGALHMLAHFHDKGLHGYEKDTCKAAWYRKAKNAPDVIMYS